MISYHRRYQENTTLLNLLKYIFDILMVILTAYVLVSFSCTRTTILGGSMEPSINNDDTVLVNKFAYAIKGPKRFDCIAFEPDSIGSSKLYVNGELLENDITDTYIVTAGMTINPVKLGDDEYFCLGDNRNNSEDSRFSSIGMVKRKHIIGKTWMVLSPFEDIKFIK